MALQDDVRSLASNPTLRDLEPDALRLIAFSAEKRELRAGDILFRMGEISDGGYVVLSGSLTLEAGNGPATVAYPPALIGDSALIAETARPCTAVALEPSSIMAISRGLFQRVLTENPESAVRLRRLLATRLLALSEDLDAYQRNLG